MSLHIAWRTTGSYLGTVLKYLALTMLVPLAVAVVTTEDVWVFVVSFAVVFGVGAALERLEYDPQLGTREALVLVSLAWLTAAFFGALPYLLATVGTDSSLAHPVNALFEAMSGFTTTGATVLSDFERHSPAVMLWRQLTQWLGGMGIIVLMVAILPELAVNGAQLMRSEAPGPELQKLTPRIAETARALWLVYFAVTALYAALLFSLHLLDLAPNMDLYNAIAHAFTTMSTGGFSPEAASIAAFSPVVQWVVVPFMVLAGVNYALMWRLSQGDVGRVLQNAELRAYLGSALVLTAVLAALLFRGAAPATDPGGVTEGVLGNTLRVAAFQIGSLMNSTGFATVDFAAWGPQAQLVLLFTMFVGGSAGSTGGGVKIVRWMVVLKTLRRDLYTTTHPDVVRPVRVGGRIVDEDAIRGILTFTVLYLVLFGFATVFIALDAARAGVELSVLESLSASLATLGNIGPGFGRLGPYGSFEFFPYSSKLLMIFLMWLGRLEIVPVLALLVAGLEDAR